MNQEGDDSMNHTAAVRSYLEDNSNQILDVQYVHTEYFPHLEKRTFLKILKRLEVNGTLSPVDKGVYYIGSAKEKDIDSAILDYYIGNFSGMVIGDALYCNLGLTDYEPRFIELYSNKLPNGKNKTVGKYRLTGAKLFFTKELAQLVSLLEIIQHKKQIIDLNYQKYQETEQRLLHSYSDTVLVSTLEAIPYSYGIVATLGALLDEAGIENQATTIARAVGLNNLE